MLYDPKWEKQTKADPFTLESLIAWLEKQPADKKYDYLCSGHCLLAEYFTAAGFQNVHMFGSGFWHGHDRCPSNIGMEEAVALGRAAQLPFGFNPIAQCGERSFGAALERARTTLTSA